MPTTKPRYTVTDTGHLATLLDTAQRRWPELRDRKALLLRLVEEGTTAIANADLAVASEQRRNRERIALARIPSLIDTSVLLSDRAWS